MVPFSSFAQTSWITTPTSSSRFHGYPSFEISGPGRAGRQLGRGDGRHREARRARSRASASPGRASPTRSGCRRARRRSSTASSLLVVFLCLAALYESWSIPVAVLLVVPLGLVGAILAVTLRGLQNDVYLQVGLLTTMGLSAKNAILMVEFAERAETRGPARDRRRDRGGADPLRPILMTSFAFIFGVLAARDRHRRRRQQPDRDRHRGDRRHADRDHPRDLLHPVLLRAGPPRRPRRHRRPSASGSAAGGRREA